MPSYDPMSDLTGGGPTNAHPAAYGNPMGASNPPPMARSAGQAGGNQRNIAMTGANMPSYPSWVNPEHANYTMNQVWGADQLFRTPDQNQFGGFPGAGQMAGQQVAGQFGPQQLGQNTQQLYNMALQSPMFRNQLSQIISNQGGANAAQAGAMGRAGTGGTGVGQAQQGLVGAQGNMQAGQLQAQMYGNAQNQAANNLGMQAGTFAQIMPLVDMLMNPQQYQPLQQTAMTGRSFYGTEGYRHQSQLGLQNDAQAYADEIRPGGVEKFVNNFLGNLNPIDLIRRGGQANG